TDLIGEFLDLRSRLLQRGAVLGIERVLERDDGIEAVVSAVQLDHHEDGVLGAGLVPGRCVSGGAADEQGRGQPQGHAARASEEVASRLAHDRSFSASGERPGQSSWNSGCVNTKWHRVRTRLSAASWAVQ